MARRDGSDALPLAGAAAAGIAVACCAGLPALAALVGGLTVAAVLGVAGGALLTAATIAAVVVVSRSHKRRRCNPARGRTAP